ncbi:MAG: FecR family protein [Rhodospirillales bacterium]|jgi:hypothetical protein
MSILRSLFIVVFIGWLIGFSGNVQSVQAAEIAGQVIRIKNTVTTVRGNETQVQGVGAIVYIGDTIKTGSAGRIQMRMLDQATITLGGSSKFKIEDYLFDREKGVGKVVMSIATGTFKAVSGGISSLQNSSFALKSPVATIGIRGAEFWGGPINGVYEIALLKGKAIIIENSGGRVEITQPGFGTRVTGSNIAPTTPVPWAPAKLQRAIDTVSF